jgi:hypothetical protein
VLVRYAKAKVAEEKHPEGAYFLNFNNKRNPVNGNIPVTLS